MAVATLVAALLLALGFGPLPTRAQQPAPSLAVTQIDASAYPRLRAVVTVLDASGVPVPGLQTQQFSASDGSAPVSVVGVERVQDANLRLSVVLAIDTSGSMAGAPLDRAKQAAIAFVDALGANDDATLIAFSDAARPVVAGFSSDHAALAAAIQSLQAGGSTVLYEAVQAAVFSARSSPAPREAIVLLTDGQNDSATSPATAAGALDAVRRAGVPVFTIGFGDQPDVAFLQSLSQASQGQYSAANTTNVSDVYAGIGRLLRGQYVLNLTAQQAADGRPAALRVVASVAGTTVAATASFTRGTAPPIVAPAATAAPPPPAQPAAGGSSTLLAVIGVLVVLALLAGGAVLLGRRAHAARAQRRREREAGRQSDEALPVAPGTLLAPADPAATAGSGRLVERAPASDRRVFELRGGPAVIGSSRRATILLDGDGVASEHARIWLRDGRYLLHHTGGIRRKTLVGGVIADWVTLESGDEIQIGAHRLVFEDAAAAGGVMTEAGAGAATREN
ncbi:MAG: VWA domain-containing protein [Dehalococcoidia bacterium]|nr:VWA domain-containing protein [Dehalococcoidia bacterium]